MPIENIKALKARLTALLKEEDFDAVTDFINDKEHKEFLRYLKQSVNYMTSSSIKEDVSELVAQIKQRWFDAIEKNKHEHYNLFKALGINVNAKNGAGQTPLVLAVQKGHVEWVSLLVNNNDLRLWSLSSVRRSGSGPQVMRMLMFTEILELINKKCDKKGYYLDYNFESIYLTLLEAKLPDNIISLLDHDDLGVLMRTFSCSILLNDDFKVAHTVLERYIMPINPKFFYLNKFSDTVIDVYDRDPVVCHNMLDTILKKNVDSEAYNFKESLFIAAISKQKYFLATKIKLAVDGKIDYNPIQDYLNFFLESHGKTFSLEVVEVLFEGRFKDESFSTQVATQFAKKALPIAFEHQDWRAIEVLIAFRQGQLFQNEAFMGNFLCLAAKQGKSEFIERLYALGLNINIDTKDPTGRTPLYHAIEFQHPLCVSLLIEKGASLYEASNNGIKPYQLETSSEVATVIQNETVRNIDHVGEDGTTALIRAVQSMDVEQVNQVLAKGASISHTIEAKVENVTHNGIVVTSYSILNYALLHFNPETFQALLLAGARLNFDQPLALLTENMLNKVELLFDKESAQTDDDLLLVIKSLFGTYNATVFHSNTEQEPIKAQAVMFYILATNGNNDKIASLLFSFASSFGFTSVLQCMINNQYPYDINALGLVECEYTALMLAAQNHHLETVQLLLSQPDTNIGYTTRGDESALTVCLNSVELVQAVLDAGFLCREENAENAFGAVKNATFKANYETVDRILESGFKDNVPSAFKEMFVTEPYLIELCGWAYIDCSFMLPPESYDVFFKHGINLEHPCSNGQTLLMLACFYNDGDLVNWLLAKGVDESVICNEGKQALDYIDRNSDEAINTFNKVAFHMVASQKEALRSGRCLFSSFDATIALCQRIKLTSDNQAKVLFEINALRFMKAQQVEHEFLLANSGVEEIATESINALVQLYEAVDVFDELGTPNDSLYKNAQYAAGEFLHQLYCNQEPDSVAATELLSRALQHFRKANNNERFSRVISSAIGHGFDECREYSIEPSLLAPQLIAEASNLKQEATELKEETGALKRGLSELEAERNGLQVENDALRIENEALQAKIAALETENKAKRQRSSASSAFFQPESMATTSSSSNAPQAVVGAEEEGLTRLSQNNTTNDSASVSGTKRSFERL